MSDEATRDPYEGYTDLTNAIEAGIFDERPRLFCSVCDTEIPDWAEWCPKCSSDSSQWVERETPPAKPLKEQERASP